jgi:hypothetical protein
VKLSKQFLVLRSFKQRCRHASFGGLFSVLVLRNGGAPSAMFELNDVDLSQEGCLRAALDLSWNTTPVKQQKYGKF